MTTVVFLHGLGRTRGSMRRLETRVRKAGYETWSRSYPSRRMGIRELADLVGRWIMEELPDRSLVVVTHSLGGILARHMGSRVPWSAVVMLAPPNQGSRVGQRLTRIQFLRRLLGPAGSEVSASGEWPELHCPVGIVAGTLGKSVWNPVSWVAQVRDGDLLDETSDGLLAVSETRMDGASDFATVPAGHTWIMNHPQVAPLVLRFLATGSFSAG